MEFLPSIVFNSNYPVTFHPFRHLPAEIRLQIWDIVLRDPQYLELRCRRHTSSPGRSDYHWHWYTVSPIPAVLHVCFESRTEALKVYQPHLLNINQKTVPLLKATSRGKYSNHQRARNTGRVYLNLERDMVIIHYPSTRNSTDQFNISTANLACADLIHNLGISSYKVTIDTLLDIYGMQLFLSPFRHLKNLFQIELTSKENHEQEIRTVLNRPGIYSFKFIYGYRFEARGWSGRREGVRMVDIGINFPRSGRFWSYALLKKALERLQENNGFGVCIVRVMGTEGVVGEGGLRPWYCFLEEMRMPDMSSRLLTW